MGLSKQVRSPGWKPMPVRIWRRFAICVLLLAASCTQSEIATPRPIVVEFAGATSMRPMLEEMASAFTALHPSVLIDIRGGGSALGEERVLSGRSTVAASTLLPNTGQSDANRSTARTGVETDTGDTPAATPSPASAGVRPAELVRAPIGIDGIAIVVHADNPVSAFTSQQLQDTFRGRILDWNELGGNDGEIILVSREDGSGAREAFEERVMGDKAVNLTAIVMPTSGDVLDFVAKNRRAIGYVSMAYVPSPSVGLVEDDGEEDDTPSDSIRVALIDGVALSDDSIRDQSYPLVQPLYLVTKGAPQGWARQFIDFALSPAGQAIVDRYHVPIR